MWRPLTLPSPLRGRGEVAVKTLHNPSLAPAGGEVASDSERVRGDYFP